MRFALFLFLNFLLFVRPEEISTSLSGLRIYLITIALCIVASYQQVIGLLSADSLRNRPITACVLIYYISTLISLVINGQASEALFGFGAEFAKVILYYLLLVAVVDTPEKFRIFVASLIGSIGLLVIIALAQLHGVTQFDGVVPYAQKVYEPDGTITSTFLRLAGAGIFSDPNDVCLAIGIGMCCCYYFITTSSAGILGSLIYLFPLSLFTYALMETHSRGGLLGVLAGGAAFIYAKYGGPRAIPYALAGITGVIFVIGGRQTEMSGGTAHQRVMLWSEGMSELSQQPHRIPFGLGKGWFYDNHSHVAHNTFVQAYIEEGLFAGGALLAAFIWGAVFVERLGRSIPAPDWVVQARPFAFAVVVGYFVGCYSLTRNHTITTYLVLGISALLVESTGASIPEKYRISWVWLRNFFIFSICGLAFIKLATQGLGMAGV